MMPPDELIWIGLGIGLTMVLRWLLFDEDGPIEG